MKNIFLSEFLRYNGGKFDETWKLSCWNHCSQSNSNLAIELPIGFFWFGPSSNRELNKIRRDIKKNNLKHSKKFQIILWSFKIFTGYEKIAESCIKSGSIDLNARDEKGLAPIHLASRGGQETVIKALLEHGDDVNRRDNFNWTALSWASFKGDFMLYVSIWGLNSQKTTVGKIVASNIQFFLNYSILDQGKSAQLLLNFGADINMAGNFSWTPLDWATYMGNC